MARRNEIAAVYGAGLIQGLALVTFPAASTVFTSASHYGLSSTEYGAHRSLSRCLSAWESGGDCRYWSAR